MKLFLMRHAEAEADLHNNDFKRVLSNRGKEEAEAAGEYLHDYHFDKMIVSYVKRAMQTAEIVKKHLPPIELEMIEELYNGPEDKIIEVLSLQEDYHKHLLVIGHNPFIYNILMQLANNDQEKYEKLMQNTISTAQVITLDFPGINNWQDIKLNSG